MIGTESISAFLKSWPSVSLSSFSALAEPNCATVTPRCSPATRSTAVMTGAISSAALSGSPFMSNWTSAERPSCEICSGWSSGEVTLVTAGCAATARCTSRTVARKAGSSAEPVLLCTSTISPAAWANPASASIVSAWRASPSYCWAVVGAFVPAMLPITSEMTTNASHPRMAVLGCRALQRPARAATPPAGLACISISPRVI